MSVSSILGGCSWMVRSATSNAVICLPDWSRYFSLPMISPLEMGATMSEVTVSSHRVTKSLMASSMAASLSFSTMRTYSGSLIWAIFKFNMPS